MNTHEYLDLLCKNLMKLKTNLFFFFAKKQFIFIKNRKENLSDGKIIVCFEFIENYGLVIQNSIQSFQWDDNEATKFIAVMYFNL